MHRAHNLQAEQLSNEESCSRKQAYHIYRVDRFPTFQNYSGNEGYKESKCPFLVCLHHDLKRPQHLDGLGEAHIIEVEVDEASEAQYAEDGPQMLDPRDKFLQVVCQHTSHTPVSMKVDKSGEEVINEGTLNKQSWRHDAHHRYRHNSLHLPVRGGHHHVTRAAFLLWCEGPTASSKVIQSSHTGWAGGEDFAAHVMVQPCWRLVHLHQQTPCPPTARP